MLTKGSHRSFGRVLNVIRCKSNLGVDKWLMLAVCVGAS